MDHSEFRQRLPFSANTYKTYILRLRKILENSGLTDPPGHVVEVSWLPLGEKSIKVKVSNTA